MELKKIGVLSLAKIAGLFGVILGLVWGAITVILISLGTAEITQQLGVLGSLGYAVILILPIAYGILYFILGSLTALVYNLLAGWVGGINIEFKK